MKILLRIIILSTIMLNCTPKLNMAADDEKAQDSHSSQDDNHLIDDFGDRIKFHEEGQIIAYLDSITNPDQVFNNIYINKEGNQEGFIHYAVHLVVWL
jgi:hypothetical protein